MKFLKTVMDRNFFKITKSEWEKVQNNVKEKQQTINKQDGVIEQQNLVIDKLERELKTLRKYEKNDDLVYMYEKENKDLIKKNYELETKITNALREINEYKFKINSAQMIEDACLRKINKLQLEKYTKMDCLEYETVSSEALETYA